MAKLTEYTDSEKKQFLVELTKAYYEHGDSYQACITKRGDWHFWYSNDYPMPCCIGKIMQLPDKIVTILMNQNHR